MKFRVLIEQDEDGIFVVEVPSLPGCITQGKTRQEALANTREAIALYLESLEAHGDPIPPGITEEIVEVKPYESPGVLPEQPRPGRLARRLREAEKGQAGEAAFLSCLGRQFSKNPTFCEPGCNGQKEGGAGAPPEAN